MPSLNDAAQAIYVITRLAPVPINIHAIVYLAGKDWSMLERDGAYVVYRITDTQGNPVTVRLRVKEAETGGSRYYEVYGMEIQFKYMGKDYLAVYPIDNAGITKTEVNDKDQLDIGTKVGGEPCIAALRIGNVPAVCKQIGRFYLVIARLE